MVNFKGGGHQGEHKRALAAQGSEASAVTKLEKLALRRDDAQRTVVNEGALALRVVAREKRLDENNSLLKAALVDADALAHFQQRAASTEHGTNAMGAPLLCRPGGDFVLAARVHSLAAPGEVLLSEAQRLTLHVCEDDWYEWTPFDTECEPLAELVLEAQLMQPTADGRPLRIEADALAKAAAKWLFGEVISSNEIFMTSYCAPVANGADGTRGGEQPVSVEASAVAVATADGRRVRALRKKLRQIHDAKAAQTAAQACGGSLPTEQLAKLEQEGAVRAELAALGVEPDVEPQRVEDGGGGEGGGVRLVLRVTDVALPPADYEDEAAAAAVSGPHCFRGVLSAAQTRVYVQPSSNFKSSALQLKLAEQLQLRNVPARPARPPRKVVHVTTSDGETFPCPKPLLKPCIALTKAVRSQHTHAPAVTARPAHPLLH